MTGTGSGLTDFKPSAVPLIASGACCGSHVGRSSGWVGSWRADGRVVSLWYSTSMAIDVFHDSGSTFRVVVSDEAGTSTHLVTVMPSDVARYAPGSTPEELLEAAFAFLLARESKDAILARFELPLIEQYFPGFAAAMDRG